MVTLGHIAARAGVSLTTVSYVLNGRGGTVGIKEETRKRVMEAAAELGYRRNSTARAMVTGRSLTLAYLSRGPADENSLRVLLGAQQRADALGYVIKLMPIFHGTDYTVPIDRCTGDRVAGVMAVNIGYESVEYLCHETQRFGIPLALMDDIDLTTVPEGAQLQLLLADVEDGIEQAIHHLVNLGHRRIGFVSAQASSPTASGRVRGFHRVMERMGLEHNEDSVIHAHWIDMEMTASVMEQHLASEGKRPTGYLCVGDRIAMVVLRVLRASGVRVPEDVSLVGFSNHEMAAFADPPLTTVDQPFEEMGRAAVDYLLQTDRAVTSTATEAERPEIILPTRLVIRDSTTVVRSTS